MENNLANPNSRNFGWNSAPKAEVGFWDVTLYALVAVGHNFDFGRGTTAPGTATRRRFLCDLLVFVFYDRLHFIGICHASFSPFELSLEEVQHSGAQHALRLVDSQFCSSR